MTILKVIAIVILIYSWSSPHIKNIELVETIRIFKYNKGVVMKCVPRKSPRPGILRKVSKL